MRIQCSNPQCQAQFEVRDSLLPLGRPRKVRCAYCRISFHVTRTMPVAGEEEEVTFENTMLLNLWNRPKDKEVLSYQQYAALVREGLVPGGKPPSLEGAKGDATLMTDGEATQPAPTLPLFQNLSLTTAQKAVHLRKSGWWQEPGEEDLACFAEYWEAFSVRKSAILFRPGDQNSFLGLVVSGEVRLLSKIEAGKKQRLLATLGPGDSLGERTLFGGYARVCQAQVKEDALLLLLFEEKLRRMNQRHPGLWQALLHKVALLMLPLASHAMPAQEDCFSMILRHDLA